MPVLHEYKYDSGVYLRTAIDGTYVTFQVYDSAARFLRESGYHDGDNVTWSIIKPLWEQGYVYTGNSGTTEQVESHLRGNQLGGMGRNERKQLDEFFERQKRRSVRVPSDVYSILSIWHDGRYSENRARELLVRADDERTFLKSIRCFDRSPLEIVGVDASKGSPRYDIISRGRSFRCVDFRAHDRETDLMITFAGPSEISQRLFVSDGRLSHRKMLEDDVSGSVLDRDLLESFPALIELLVDVPDYDLALDLWNLQEASKHTIQEDISKCLQVDWERCVASVGKQDRTGQPMNGVVEFTTSIGYGVLSSDEYERRLVFSLHDDTWSERQPVRFRLRRSNGRTRATELGERESEPGSGEGPNLVMRGPTKYGGLIRRPEEIKRRAESGEFDWFDGQISTIDGKNGTGCVEIQNSKLCFSTQALSDLNVTSSSPVRVILSKDKEKVLYIESRDPEETGEPEAESKVTTDERPLRDGQSRRGHLRYLNRLYGSLSVEDSSRTVLFESDEFPSRRGNASPRMAFDFDVVEHDGNLRAMNLKRRPSRDRVDDNELLEIPATESIPIDKPTTDWIVRNASNGLRIFDAIEAAIDFGLEIVDYESSIKAFGNVEGWEVADFKLSDVGHPIYQFPLGTEGFWTVEHCITESRFVVDIVINPEAGPVHLGRAVNGSFVHWRPSLNRSQLSDSDRHEFIRSQGRYVEMVEEYLSLVC